MRGLSFGGLRWVLAALVLLLVPAMASAQFGPRDAYGSSYTVTPNVFGGHNYPGGAYSTPNVFGGSNY